MSQSSVAEKVADVLTGRKLRGNPIDRIRFYAGWAASIFAVITLVVLGVNAPPIPSASERLKTIALPFLAVWTVVPPMYFWFDYFVLWHIETKHNTGQFASLDEFKHGQELSRNLWLVIVALLAALYYSRVHQSRCTN